MATCRLQIFVALLGSFVFVAACDKKATTSPGSNAGPETKESAPADLWRVYDQTLKTAKYIDLTHTLTSGRSAAHPMGSPGWKSLAKSAPSDRGPAPIMRV